MRRESLGLKAAGLAAAVGLLATACGGAKVESDDSGGGGACTMNLAMNDWVGYTANAAVVTYLAEEELGCTVKQKSLKE
ncbi:MAG: glycine/betaine ABC transporter substrate-binding protein, partial [Actinophytocola sp.]|nr:glycine/betaine ABC transporter substrate-binding protein [Actinophytocola sp.]